MAIDFAPEFGTKFTLTGPDGTVATFNDNTDANNVGVLTAVTGLDSAEVRESGDVLTEFDGGVQGPGYFGRRPIVLEGLVYGHTTAQARAAKINKLMRATNAMRGDAQLKWTPSVTGAQEVYLNLRRQQPLRVDGGWNKNFQAAMVAADPRIYSTAAQFAQGNISGTLLTPVNDGNTETFPIYTLTGPGTNPTIHNALSGLDITVAGVLTFSDALYIDTLNRTVLKGGRSPGTRFNLFPNSSFESASHGLTSPTNVTLTIVGQPGGKPVSGWGSSVLRYAITSGTAAVSATMLDAAPGSVSPGSSITTGFSYIADTITGGNTSVPRITFVWKTAANAVISTVNVDGVAGDAPSASAWKRFKAYSIAPATAAKVDITWTFLANHTGTSNYYLDGMTVEPTGLTGSDGAFYNGTHPLTALGHLGDWFGTVNNSMSASYTTSFDMAGTIVAVTPAYSMINFAATRWSGLLPGSNSITLTATATTAGFAARADWRNAWL